ncbi:hypothetical protein [Streptomyces filamentosus]|uniref:hypothetical protein n=1 Tax=Streptomyces filamentosus TaxID=67294 RepID=UPI00123C17FE|nr:hypothetical protein [Streptomyces filamentosus]KAA6211791.1 hypothetical protein CP979_36090 [Streptomyces filamentosus]KAA6220025.1 hypothetical protein CP979_26370 [Streptomyces filamentosus]
MTDNAGWHIGPDGYREPGFIEGTAFQPDGVQDHLDAWGTPHPGNLAACLECGNAAEIDEVTPW